jgi:putative ABC transport system permease protein
VVLLAPEAVRQLYDGDDAAAVGSTVRINRASFQVVGTLKSDGHFDKIALMPLGTARAYLLGGHDTITSMAAKAIDVARVGPAVDEITTVLDKRHHIRDPAKRDFTVTALRDTLTKVDQTLNYLTLFIASIAGISLLVGGVGVANIMLVSVTERTREIGIRKALGAPRSAIVKQFLIESTTLTCVGGVLGCALGVGLILIGAAVVNRMMPEFGSPSVPVPALLVALGASLLIGLVAGGYPALRAARLRPIEALRHE